MTASLPARLAPLLLIVLGLPAWGQDVLKELQTNYAAHATQKAFRAYHFGSQGPGDVFSNHASHSNRLIPVYTFGRTVDLASVTGKNSPYRDPARIKALYGTLPEHTLNPEAEYADQSEFYRVQRDAVARGAKYLFIVWFDGLDWPTTQAAAIAKTGRVYTEGKGSGLLFQDYPADGSAQFTWYVTSPTHDQNRPDVDAQTVTIPAGSLGGGYDARIAGSNPWTLGPLGAKAPGYFKGQSANAADRQGVEAVGGALHAYTDSSTSAASFISGYKAYNNGLNVTDDGRFVPTLFHELQAKGWKLGTVTSVPFNHASPAAMYAHNVHRDDYQDLARDMLGLPHVAHEAKRDARHPGLDVVMGAGWGQITNTRSLKAQGENGVAGGLHVTAADLAAVDVANGGAYRIVHTTPGADAGRLLHEAAAAAASRGERLLGLFGSRTLNHLPYRTADGKYDPAPDVDGYFEQYNAEVLKEQPTLAAMTAAALEVLGSRPGQPFALFVEAGDVDFALHRNNLDNAVGAVLSGEEALRVVFDWVEKHSNWDESVLIATADHGHYLVLDDPKALAP